MWHLCYYLCYSHYDQPKLAMRAYSYWYWYANIPIEALSAPSDLPVSITLLAAVLVYSRGSHEEVSSSAQMLIGARSACMWLLRQLACISGSFCACLCPNDAVFCFCLVGLNNAEMRRWGAIFYGRAPHAVPSIFSPGLLYCSSPIEP